MNANSQSERPPRNPRRHRRRKWIALAIVLLLALAVVGWFAPRLAGTSLGLRAVNSFLPNNSDTRIRVKSLDLRWVGEQRIPSVTIEQDGGRISADLAIIANGALWRLGNASGDKGTVKVGGVVTVRQASGEGNKVASKSGKPFAVFGDGFAVRLELDDLAVHYKSSDDALSETGESSDDVRLEQLNGAVDFAVAGRGRLEWNANASAISGDRRGSVQTRGTCVNFIKPDAALDLRQAEFDAEVQADRLDTRLIDSMLALDHALVELAGDWITVRSELDLKNGTGASSFNLESANAHVNVQSNIAENRITLTAPATAEVEIDQRVAALVERFVPSDSGVSIAGLRGRMKLTIQELNAGIGETGIDTKGLAFTARLEGAAESLRMQHETINEIGLANIVAVMETADLSRGLDASMHGVGRLTTSNATNHTMSIDNARLRIDGPLTDSLRSNSIDELNIAVNLELRQFDLKPFEALLAQTKAEGWLEDVAGSSLDSVLLSLGHAAGAEGNPWTIGMDGSSASVIIQTRALWHDGRLFADASHKNRIEITPSDALTGRMSTTLAELSAEPGPEFDDLDSIVINASSFSIDPNRAAETALDLDVSFDGMSGSVPRELLTPILTPSTERANVIFNQGTLSLISDNVSERVTGEFRMDGLLDGEPLGFESEFSADAIFESNGRSFWASPIVRYLSSSCSLDVQLAEGPTDAVFRVAGSAALNSPLLDRMLPEDSIEFEGPVQAQFNVEPMSLWRDPTTGTFAWSEFWNHVPIKASATSAPVLLSSIPSIAQPAEVSALELRLNYPQGLAGADVRAPVPPVRPEANRETKAVDFDVQLDARRSGDGSFDPGNVTARLTQVNVESMERFFARQPGEWTTWLGSTGGTTIEWTPKKTANETVPTAAHVRLDARFDRLTATGSMEVQEDYLVIDPDSQVSMRIDRMFVERILNEKVDLKTANKAGATRFRVPTDVRARMTSRSGVIPRPREEGLLAKVTEVILDASVKVDPFDVEFSPSSNKRQSLRVAALSFDCFGGPLPEGILFEGASTIEIASRQQPTRLNLNGAVQGETARPIEWWFTGVEGTYENMPVAFFDGLWNTNGHLVASLGDTVNMTVNANEFGRGRGEVRLNMTSPNGTLAIGEARLGADGRIWIGEESITRARIESEALEFPAWASLDVTDQMSRTVLRNVSPLLFDVKKKTDPIRAEATMIRYPLDGDLARLDADVVLDLGQIDVPSRGFLNDVLGSFGAQQPAYTTTRIPPIHIRIRSGKLQYDRLVLQAARFNIVTGGSINLKTRQLDLYAEPPAIGWQTFFGDFRLPGMKRESLDDLSIPFYLRIRGTVDNPKIEPDPQMARRLVEDVFDTAVRNPIFNLVNDVLRERNQQQPQNKPNDDGG